MRDENGGTGAGDRTGNTKRVGTVERDEAITQLDEHWRAGRLDPGEHELRVSKARAAVTQADLDALFKDLPLTGPGPESTRAPGARGLMEDRRETIIALTPFAALVLFFTTGSWEWFLIVPVMGILLYGPGGRKNPRRRDRGGRGRQDGR